MEKRSQRSHQQQRSPKKGSAAKHKTLLGIAIVLLVMLTGIGCGFLTASMNTKSDLADDIRPPASSLVYDSNGNEIATIHAAENRMPVKLDQVPQNLQDAFVAVEDNRFYDHIGVDPRGIARAIWANLRGRTVSEGGSTITQQLAKNAYLTQDRTLKRKIQEVFLALRLEHQYTKSEILELYLNQIYFGQGAYGVQAAARTYFGKDVEDLTLNECAMLAGIPKSPNYYSPLNNLQAAQERKATVLDQMVKYGYLDSATAEKTKTEKLDLVKPDPKSEDKGEASYFVDYVTQKLIDKYGADAVYKDGLQVYTTIDMDMQRAAEKAMKGLPNGRKDSNGVMQPQGSLVAIDPHTGYVKAMVGGRGTDQFNRATMAERQPGSAFKPFVFAAALENKFTPSTVINDSPIKIGDWEPQNDEHTFSGPVTMRQVAQHSMNVPTVKIAQKIGIEKVLYYAEEMGITTLVKDGPHNDNNLSSALGGLTKGVTPLELTSAYGTFANKGVHVDPVVIVRVLDRNGKVIDEANPEQHNVISESSAAELTSMLQDVISAGTGRRANIGRPAAGKTGTTSDYHDAWFVGYTPDLVASVWIGNDDNTSLGGIYGGTVPATIWKNFMTEALKGIPAKDFEGAESSGGDSIGSLEDDKSTAVSKKSAEPAKKETKSTETKAKDDGKKQPGQQPAAPQGQAPAPAPASAGGGGGGAAPEPGSSVSKGRN